MEEKYGFIYIWRDRKRNMYYIGCHWGTIEDGYICSSNRMRDAYRRRQEDFKRRIIWKTKDRSILLEEEHRWLLLISDDQLGEKYYNLSKKHFGHWTNNPDSRSTIEKMKVNQKIVYDNMSSEERNQKFGYWKGKTGANKGKSMSDEQKEKLRQANLGKKNPEHSVKMKGRPNPNKGKKASEETKAKISAAQLGKKRGPRSEEVKRKIGEKNRLKMKLLWQDKEYQQQQRISHIGYIMPQSQKEAISQGVRR